MKKKITSFFAMALLFAGTANAQVEELQGLKAVEIGDEVMTVDQIVPETQWYAIYQARAYGNYTGGYWWDAPEGYELLAGGVPATICKTRGTSMLDGNPLASEAASALVRFLPTETEGTFIVQFGTGNYVDNNLAATDNLVDAAQIRVYNIVTADEVLNAGHWGLNVVEGDKRIDNNGSGNGLAPWGTGTITEIGGNNDHQIYAINFTEVSELDAAINEAMNVYTEYVDYYNTFDDRLEPGVPGNYDAAAVAAFQAALDAVSILDSPDAESMTVEQIKAMAQAIKDTYEAVLASKIPLGMDVAEGYYLIQTAPFFYETTTTEETVSPEGDIIPGETITTNLSKGLRGTMSGGNVFASWGTYDETAVDRATFLWKVTKKGDKLYQLRNMGYEVNAAYWTSSNNLYLNEGDSTVVFDYNAYVDEEGNKYYNIRPSQNAESDYFYFHCNNHGSGAGTEDWIVKWSGSDGSSAGASEWKLIPVNEADVQAMIDAFAPIKNEEARVDHAATMIADAEPKMVIAVDSKTEVSEAQITDASQLSSPYTESREGSIDALLDGEVSATSFWHSDWSSNPGVGVHYLQVELTQPLEEAAFKFSRRAVQNDHITKWGVYGANDTEAEKDACTLLANIDTPFGANDETITSSVFPVGNFTYLRFYVEETVAAAGGSNNDRGYFHLSEFQLYAAKTTLNPTNQAVGMGDVYTNLEKAIADAKGDSIISVEHYNALVAAYDAFIAMYVNPDTLRNKVTEIDGVENYIKIGDNPGQWKDATSAKGVTDAVAAAQAYDKAGKYSLEQSQAHIKAMDDAKAAMLAAANKIELGKWYTFQFATEEMYETNEWDMTGADARFNEDETVQQYPALFGKYVSTGQEVVEDGAHDYIAVEAEETSAGTGLFYLDEGELGSDSHLFRFINFNDTAVVIQNKATGLYLYTAGGTVNLQPAATTFKANAMGYGKVMLTGHNPNGDYIEHLHAQRDGNRLVTWGADGVASNTGFLIQAVEDVADYDGTEFQIAMEPNSMNSFCYPVDITATEGELYGVEIEGSEIVLTKMADKTAKAGEPFIYINGDYKAYDAEAENVENELVTFKHGESFVAEPKAVGKHVGTFYGLSGDNAVTKGNVLVTPAGLVIGKSNKNNVGAFSSYIHAELDTEATLNVTVKEDGTFDSIQEVVSQAVKGGDIYTIDGKYVGKGNLNSKLSRGMYIINGVKVIVK